MTVAELIERLRAFDGDRQVVIHDMDTDWWLHIATVRDCEAAIELNGGLQFDDQYHDRDDDASYGAAVAAVLGGLRDIDMTEKPPACGDIPVVRAGHVTTRSCRLPAGHMGPHDFDGAD